MKSYKVLRKQSYSIDEYSIVPIRLEDRYDIMQWRNEQIYHLRQSEPLTKEGQDKYFNETISLLFEKDQPNQILFSYLKNDECIGYGGLVHINWLDKNAEISFIMKTELEQNEFKKHWHIFLGLIEEVAFEDINLHKLLTYAFDLRPHLYEVLEKIDYRKEAVLKEQCLFNNKFIDVVIHSKINNNMKFYSERLSLKEFDEKLLNEKVLSWFKNPDLMEYYTNSKVEITKERLLNAIEEGRNDNNNYTYFIVHTQSNDIIGTLKLGPISVAHKTSDLVALIGESGYGKGIGTEAIGLGIRLAFEKYDIRKLLGGMYASNIGSIKAYTRAGWIVEGLLHGHYLNKDQNEDRLLVGCFNPKYFTKEEINNAKFKKWYDAN